jgi:serine/threonine protein kinase
MIKIKKMVANKYKLLHKLAEGCYGKVYAGKDLESGVTVAIKIQVNDNYCVADNENSALRKTKSAHIIKCLACFSRQNLIYMVFPLFTCDLKVFLNNHKHNPLPLELCMSFTYQIMTAVATCHSKGIIHRDIKPSNIFIKDDRLVLGDFGLATRIGSNHTIEASTLWYRSPEVLLNKYNYDEKVDIWAAACVICELFLSAKMFTGDCQIDQVFKIFKKFGTPDNLDMMHFKSTFPKWPYQRLEIPNAPAPLVAILTECFKYRPQDRCSAQDVLRSIS